MGKQLEDSEIMSNVLQELRMSANSLSKKIDVTAGSIYHVLNGVNSISENLKVRIINAFPKVSYNYLSRGELPILEDRNISQSMQNILGGDKALRRPGFEDIPALLIQMNKKFDKILDILETKKAED